MSNKQYMKILLSFVISILFTNIIICFEKPLIDIHYESLCPECEEFIRKSLKEFLKNPDFTKMAILTFYPYGNVKEYYKVGDFYQFSCQHGPNECYGNMIHGCGLNKLNYSDGLKYLVCIEENILKFKKDFSRTLDYCIKDIDLKKDIYKCANGKKGNHLHHYIGSFRPKESRYVPYITVNGIHNRNTELKILKNLNEYLCLYSKDNLKLKGCQKYLY